MNPGRQVHVPNVHGESVDKCALRRAVMFVFYNKEATKPYQTYIIVMIVNILSTCNNVDFYKNDESTTGSMENQQYNYLPNFLIIFVLGIIRI